MSLKPFKTVHNNYLPVMGCAAALGDKIPLKSYQVVYPFRISACRFHSIKIEFSHNPLLHLDL